MNDRRRDKLHKAIELIERAGNIIETVQDEEEECMSNIPESLQSSNRYERMEDICEALEKAREYCDCVTESLEEAIC